MNGQEQEDTRNHAMARPKFRCGHRNDKHESVEGQWSNAPRKGSRKCLHCEALICAQCHADNNCPDRPKGT